MKLVFYGGGDEEENTLLNRKSLELTQKKNPKITYVPSFSYGGDSYFQEFVDQFSDYKLSRFLYFPVDAPFSEILLREVLSSDIIHLAGGNTYYFLKYLRRVGMLKHLKDFVRRGGVLTGLSAGAIMMTPNIQTAGFPDFDKDENEEGIKNLKSLGLVGFEFFPHYKNSRRYDLELLKHSRSTKIPLYACPDGCGIIVEGESLSFIGRAYCFFQGQKILLSSKGKKLIA